MAFNGSGTYSFPVNSFNPAVAATDISPADWNSTATDLAAALSTCITKDGQTVATALIPFAQGLSSAGVIYAVQASAGAALMTNQNTTNGVASYASVNAINSAAEYCGCTIRSPSFTPSGVYRASGGIVECSGSGGLTLNTLGGAYSIYFAVNSTEYARFGTDGSLLVGTTTNGGTLGSAKLAVEGAGTGSTAIQSTLQTSTGYCHSWRLNNSSGSYLNLTFNGTTQIGSITPTGGGTGVAFNTSSDYRLKDITGDVAGSGAFIDGLKPRVGTWKDGGEKFVGFVAHELQEVSPSSVTGKKDGDSFQAVAYASPEIMANIVAELKSLRGRVAALEAT